MSYKTFARVVFAAVLFSAVLLTMPAAKAALPVPSYGDALIGQANAINNESGPNAAGPAFTTTPLKQMDSVDVELNPIVTPTETVYLTPAPTVVGANTPSTAGYFSQANTFRTLVVSLSMLAAGCAMICLAGITKSPDLRITQLTI